ncbi:putative periplasmic binding protein-like I [Medicago truncatula]|uniref:Putative periplasmic binding protein-like I n=1 Tax=Medicago truncatula TaxID=3880 RepID=A0A396GL43_MEDTR|nr:putative periplasmic binding protein-like I [Medicago truncatula]
MNKVWLLVLMMFYNSLPIKTISNVSARPSTINIGAILSFNSTIGRVAKVAIEAAVDDINSNPKVLSGTKLNISMLDTKSSPGFLGIVDCKSLSNTHHIFVSTLHFFLQKHVYYLQSLKIEPEIWIMVQSVQLIQPW